MKTVKFDTLFQDELSDPEFIPGYLQASYEEGGIPTFLEALRKVVQANQGMKRIAAEANVSRESLYRSLSAEGNPRIETIDNLLNSLGLKFEFVASQSSMDKNS